MCLPLDPTRHRPPSVPLVVLAKYFERTYSKCPTTLTLFLPGIKEKGGKKKEEAFTLAGSSNSADNESSNLLINDVPLST